MKKLLLYAAAVATVALAAGCAAPNMQGMTTVGIDAQAMSAAQIKESVALLKAGKEKDSNVTCYRIPTPWGVASVVEGNANTSGRMRGGITMTSDCTMSITHDSMPDPAMLAREQAAIEARRNLTPPPPPQ